MRVIHSGLFGVGQALPHNSVEENGVFDSGDPERAVDYGHVFDYDSAGTYSSFANLMKRLA